MVRPTDRMEWDGIVRWQVSALHIKRRYEGYLIAMRATKCENPAYWRKLLKTARSENEKR